MNGTTTQGSSPIITLGGYLQTIELEADKFECSELKRNMKKFYVEENRKMLLKKYSDNFEASLEKIKSYSKGELENIRPPHILQQTLDFLCNNLPGSAMKYEMNFVYFFDRWRALVKDFSRIEKFMAPLKSSILLGEKLIDSSLTLLGERKCFVTSSTITTISCQEEDSNSKPTSTTSNEFLSFAGFESEILNNLIDAITTLLKCYDESNFQKNRILKTFSNNISEKDKVTLDFFVHTSQRKSHFIQMLCQIIIIKDGKKSYPRLNSLFSKYEEDLKGQFFDLLQFSNYNLMALRQFVQKTLEEHDFPLLTLLSNNRYTQLAVEIFMKDSLNIGLNDDNHVAGIVFEIIGLDKDAYNEIKKVFGTKKDAIFNNVNNLKLLRKLNQSVAHSLCVSLTLVFLFKINTATDENS